MMLEEIVSLDRFHPGSTLPFFNDLGMDSAPLSHLRKCWWTKPRTPQLSVIPMHSMSLSTSVCPWHVLHDITRTHTHTAQLYDVSILSYGVYAKFVFIDWLFMILMSFAWSAHRFYLCQLLWTTQDTWKWQATLLLLGFSRRHSFDRRHLKR